MADIKAKDCYNTCKDAGTHTHRHYNDTGFAAEKHPFETFCPSVRVNMSSPLSTPDFGDEEA